MLQGPEQTIKRSRKLRSEMSLPEVLLWQVLRTKPAGLKFRRQHPAGPYTADFFCHDARLVIEVDGEAHNRGDQPERDEARDAWFAERRFDVMRIPAREVLNNLDGVVRGIAERATNPPLQGEVAARSADGGVSAPPEKSRPPRQSGQTDTPPSGFAGHLPLQGRI